MKFRKNELMIKRKNLEYFQKEGGVKKAIIFYSLFYTFTMIMIFLSFMKIPYSSCYNVIAAFSFFSVLGGTIDLIKYFKYKKNNNIVS